MRRSHFKTFAPICPSCRRDGTASTLELARVFAEERDDWIVEGLLACPACGAHHPIIDGLPILVADVAGYLAANVHQVMWRDGLSPAVQALVAGSVAPESPWSTARLCASSYCRDHYGAHDSAETGPPPGAAARLLDEALVLLGRPPTGPVIDLGCGVGGTALALAERVPGAPVLGVELSFDLARTAVNVLRTGRLSYLRRREGQIYQGRSFDVPTPGAERVDVWVADAALLPLPTGCSGLAVSLNVLDSIHDPQMHLCECKRVLAPGGALLTASPYDWATRTTPATRWLGGVGAVDSGAALRELLQADPHALTITGEGEGDWQVWLHDRSVMRYRCHLVAARAG